MIINYKDVPKFKNQNEFINHLCGINNKIFVMLNILNEYKISKNLNDKQFKEIRGTFELDEMIYKDYEYLHVSGLKHNIKSIDEYIEREYNININNYLEEKYNVKLE